MHNDKEFEVKELGVFSPHPLKLPELRAGDVGFVIANVKEVADAKVGDTITSVKGAAEEPLSGFQEVKPWCSCRCLSSGHQRLRRPSRSFTSIGLE